MMSNSDMKITAIAPWFGGKRTLAPVIARQCCRPDGRAPRSFWEICCGCMAVTLAMPRCAHHHVVDLHDDLINLARIIKDPRDGPRLYRQLRRVMNHERLFHEAKTDLEPHFANLFNVEVSALSPLDRAVAFFIVSWQGRNGVAGTDRVNYQPAIRWTSGGGHGAVRFAGAVASIPAWRRRLRDITVIQRDLFEVLEKIEDEPGTSIYVDPPYLRDGARSGSCAYEHEFEIADHHRLRKAVHRFRNVRVVMSYYDHPILHEWYPDWTFVQLTTQKNLHVQNRRGVGRCEAPEVLLINGPSYAAGSAA